MTSRPSQRLLGAALLAAAIPIGAAPGCGRTGLRDLTEPPVGSGGSDAGVEEDAGPPPQCELRPVGQPLEVSFAGAPNTSTTLAVISPGDLASATGAVLALQAITSNAPQFPHSVNLAVDLRVGREWPGEVAPIHDAVIFGVESHTYGMTARSSGTEPRLAILYAGDPNGPIQTLFRGMNTEAWAPEPVAPLEVLGSSPADIVAGAHITGGVYEGSGYGLAWFHPVSAGGNSTVGRVAIVNESGQTGFEPIDVTGTGPAPSNAPRLIWTGTTYLVVTAQNVCEGDLCIPGAVTIGRIDPSAEIPYQVISTVPVLDFEGTLGRPTLARVGSEVWAAWAEGVGDLPSAVHVVRMDPNGTFLGDAVWSSPALDTRRVVLTGDPSDRPVLSWIGVGDETLPPGALGGSLLITQTLSRETGEPMGDAVEMPIHGTTSGLLGIVPTAFPHGLFAVSTAANTTYLHRLDCGDTLPLQGGE